MLKGGMILSTEILFQDMVTQKYINKQWIKAR